MKNTYSIVEYQGTKYKVCKDSKGNTFLLNFETLLPNYLYSKKNSGYFSNSNSDYVHRIVMKCKVKDGKSIDHINRIINDNRDSNLRIATKTEQNYNQSKRQRRGVLPKDCGININDLPTHISYIKAETSNGEGFCIEIWKKYKKKQTRSTKFTLLEKFEMAKAELKKLKIEEPHLFEGCCDGELTEQGKILEKEYYEIMEVYNKSL